MSLMLTVKSVMSALLSARYLNTIGKSFWIVIDFEHDSDNIKLSIWDNGPGVEFYVPPHLFDRYFAVGQTRKL